MMDRAKTPNGKVKKTSDKKIRTDRCPVCNGKTKGFSDNYFVKTCMCDEVKELEKMDGCNWDEDSYYV